MQNITKPLQFLDMKTTPLSEEAIDSVFALLKLSTENDRAMKSFQSLSGLPNEEPVISVSARVLHQDSQG